ncbi:activator-dependent family glycosyltransferase [Streptoalloteichus hindustanus]|uniref:L-rhodinosyltransferase/glycosyltransferase/L-2-deoxyfucosyltransferase/glycosyltransferase OleGII n=1 Tax=Streptoalloteichus hindustanus TaxID=2017 RepID=A0A1M5I108_STRHI|nr:activator-dependent family glycosyltransferase [Streptoalloteichus hindustanus]SHG21720.1 L-rhodinosyltransferase/glycosyltransferase/L-2-deoxyfucosyltransferase/glycosyltransferase OleGII [Streptoalloteichus hindustanus]
MRVLFTPFSTAPHVYNVVPLAWALHTAGHEVRVAAHPDIVDRITASGLTAVPVGRPLGIEDAIDQWPGEEFMDALTDDVGLATTTDSRVEKWLRMLVLGSLSMYFCDDFPTGGHRSMVDDLVAAARQWRPDLVLWDPVNVAGAVAARASGAVHARLLFGHDLVARMRTTFTERAAGRPDAAEDTVGGWLAAALARFGCSFDEEVLLGQWTVDPMPSWMRFPLDLTSVPVRNIPYNGVAAVPDWLREQPKRPRVCVTLGVSQREVWGRDQVLVSDILAAVAEHDVEVVATLTADQLTSTASVPDNVRLVDYVPLHVLLPTCAAIIHHGGTGTYANAALHGVPQLIVPIQLWDEELIAERVARRGAGLAIHPEELTAAGVKDALGRLLSEPGFVSGAERIRADLQATPSPRDIVPVLERLTAEHANRP